MSDISTLISTLGLLKHPEGGYYKETYRSTLRLTKGSLPANFSGDRDLSTSIYFLLPSSEKSLLHRIKSDELWHFHAGTALSIYVINDNGLTIHKLGSNVLIGESFQVMVPANSWFGAINENGGFTLAACTVAPGFDFHDFELARREELLKQFPHCEREIVLLTNES
jgi:uncharacterized protein